MSLATAAVADTRSFKKATTVSLKRESFRRVAKLSFKRLAVVELTASCEISASRSKSP
jgi:hypothetical protein